MSEREIPKASSAEFDQLQKKLVPLWKSIERFNQDPQTIVVVPSMSIDAIDSGVRGTVLIFVTAAASAASAPDLRDVANDSTEHH